LLTSLKDKGDESNFDYTINILEEKYPGTEEAFLNFINPTPIIRR